MKEAQVLIGQADYWRDSIPKPHVEAPLSLLKRGGHRLIFTTNATRFRVQLQPNAAPIQA